jgi:hypothetical protein
MLAHAIGQPPFREKEMHNRGLLSENDREIAELSGQAVPVIQTSKRMATRATFWIIIAFCVTGLICSLYVPSSYLYIEQTPALLAEAPLS